MFGATLAAIDLFGASDTRWYLDTRAFFHVSSNQHTFDSIDINQTSIINIIGGQTYDITYTSSINFQLFPSSIKKVNNILYVLNVNILLVLIRISAFLSIAKEDELWPPEFKIQIMDFINFSLRNHQCKPMLPP